jgi:hypothetical protein
MSRHVGAEDRPTHIPPFGTFTAATAPHHLARSFEVSAALGRCVGDPDLAVERERAQLVASLLVERAVIEPSVARGRMFELVEDRL